MSERKGINKYYPPDWDPAKIPKKKKPANQIIKVRLMAPFSMRCTKCNEYISDRRKFNARKEVTKEMYMSFKIIRFHITCPKCNNNITFKTSPQTAGYVPESGAVRNYEPKADTAKKDKAETEEEILERLEKEEKENKSFQVLKEKRKKNPFWQKNESLKDQKGDLMENLEKRLQDQQRQQDLNDHLEQLQSASSELQAKGGRDKALNEARLKIEREIEQIKASQEESFNREDEELAKNAFRKFNSDGISDQDQLHRKRSYESALLQDNSQTASTSPVVKKTQTITIKKKPVLLKPLPQVANINKPISNGSLGEALGDYSSSDEDE